MRNKPIRFLYMLAAGIVVGYLLEFLVPNDKPDDHKIFHFITSVSITFLVWEGNLRIDTWMNKNYPWLKMPMKRILVHLPTSLIYTSVTIFVSMLLFDAFVCSIPHTNKGGLMISSIIIGILVTIIVLSIEIGSQFFSQWKSSLVEVEKYKTESVQAQLQNLKNQVNPHFLFNNLSVLSSLVYKDQDKAVDFIDQLSKVYRYLLDTRNSELISLREEMAFVNAYTYLLKIRFDTNIHFYINVPESKMNLLLPPMTLQILIENSIKHNEVSTEQPLYVSITEKDNVLEVKNNFQPRTTIERSSKTGLQNIKDRYNYYTNTEVIVQSDSQFFTVKIPLLNKV